MNSFSKFTVCVAILIGISANLSAQGPKDEGKNWRDRIMSEKIAFLTNAIGLTPEEAQAFWPVYNQTWDERGKAQFAVMEAYRALEKAVDENKSAEIPALLDKYLDAVKAKDKLNAACADRFRKVLTTEKVARLYVGEERFRMEQIHKLHHRGK